MKNRVIKFLCALFLRKKGSPPPQKRVLIVSTTGLGDTLWATPSLRALKKKDPTLFLAVLTSPGGSMALEGNPHIDALLTFKSISIFFTLKDLRFDTICLFHASQRVIFPLCYFLFPFRFIGTAGINKGLDSLFTHLIPPSHDHEIVRRLSLVGVKGAGTEMEVFFHTPAISLPPDSYGIHPGAKDKFKQWTPEYYAELGRRLIKETQGTIFLTGSAEEKPLLTLIASQIPGSHILILPLPLLAAHMKQFRCFITNDTGPMHLALALKVPTLALFAPTDPTLCGPLNAPYAQIVQAPPTCFPCLKQKCHEPFCLRQISVDDVINKIKKMFPNFRR